VVSFGNELGAPQLSEEFPFDLYSSKSMLEYQIGEALFIYLDKLPAAKQAELIDLLDIWVKKYAEEIRNKAR